MATAMPLGENYDESGKWLGAGSFPPETTQYFTFHYKGEAGIDDTGFVVAPLLIEHLEANHPGLTVLDLEGRTLKDADVSARPALQTHGETGGLSLSQTGG